MKAQENLIENHGVIILIIAFVILFIILMLNYAASHGFTTPQLPGNPFMNP
jgi:hypothetical protein